jgi:hypothetical protein
VQASGFDSESEGRWFDPAPTTASGDPTHHALGDRHAGCGSPLGASSVDAAHNDGDGLDSRRAHGWQGGARVVPEPDRFVIHAGRATFGFMITFRVAWLWLCRVVFGGRRSRLRGHRGSRWHYRADAFRAPRRQIEQPRAATALTGTVRITSGLAVSGQVGVITVGCPSGRREIGGGIGERDHVGTPLVTFCNERWTCGRSGSGREGRGRRPFQPRFMGFLRDVQPDRNWVPGDSLSWSDRGSRDGDSGGGELPGSPSGSPHQVPCPLLPSAPF